MTWSFHLLKQDATVSQLTVLNVLLGVKVSVTCSGGGCPRSTTLVAEAPKARCKKGKRCKASKPPRTVNVSLAALFQGRHLKYGNKITVRMTRPAWVRKVYVFTMSQHGIQPVIACLAAGPGQGC